MTADLEENIREVKGELRELRETLLSFNGLIGRLNLVLWAICASGLLTWILQITKMTNEQTDEASVVMVYQPSHAKVKSSVRPRGFRTQEVSAGG